MCWMSDSSCYHILSVWPFSFTLFYLTSFSHSLSHLLFNYSKQLLKNILTLLSFCRRYCLVTLSIKSTSLSLSLPFFLWESLRKCKTVAFGVMQTLSCSRNVPWWYQTGGGIFPLSFISLLFSDLNWCRWWQDLIRTGFLTVVDFLLLMSSTYL